MNQDISPAAFSFLLNDSHEKIVYGVLKKLHILPHHNNYEDLFMEGCLLFVQAYMNYTKAHPHIIEHELLLFAYQKIRWGLLDILRRDTLLQSRTEASSTSLETAIEEADFAADCLVKDQLNQLLHKCTPRERTFLKLRYFKDFSIAEIAQQFKVSRTAVYKWQQSVRQKAMKILLE